MGDAGFFKGTSADQDSRFSNKEKKLLKSMSFPPEFDQKVNMKKVKLDVIKPWMTQRITELLGVEDELVIDFAFGLLEEKDPDPKLMQINLTGFLEKNTQQFILELWKLLLSAQDSVSGIPKQFLEQKKQEILKNQQQQTELKARQDAVMDAIRRRKEAEKDDYRSGGRRSRFDQPRRRSPSPRRYRSRSRSPSRKYHRRDRYRSSRRYDDDNDDDRSSRRRRSRSRDRSPRRHYRKSSHERRRRSPSTPRRRHDSISPTRRNSPSPSRRRNASREKENSPTPPQRTSKWDTDEHDDDPRKKTAELREQALASLMKRRETSQGQE
ncbi:pwi domain-containing protein [Lichtheimia corymbifera JMRC:FSU:9682]|uniref:Pwi domain-containing protein n=1 Tax=Lichtheimia corymbifera JMRC:FSU:9682 TaxID=1263082 RepID=A0A068RMZ2_9FUNG|nr:pwi domain-containing protein [Lichtheimia corymbifera JMRC:FSU:9682]